VTPPQYIGAFLGAVGIVLFTREGLNLLANPKEWLERYGRSTADNHIRATRFIGWMFLAFALMVILQFIGVLLRGF
jgi:hypothetical protein